MFTIEKGIPVPPTTRRQANEKFPFGQMEVGDSFFVANKSLEFGEGTPAAKVDAAAAKANQATYNGIARAKSAFVKANEGKQFTLRKVENGVRVWRTA